MTNFFKPEDFSIEKGETINPWIDVYWDKRSAELANAKLAREGQVVRGYYSGETFYCGTGPQTEDDTHTGYLVGVEKIKEEDAKSLLRELAQEYLRSPNKFQYNIGGIMKKVGIFLDKQDVK